MSALCIIVGDARKALAKLPAGSVQCCVTSPPYWRQRKYLPAGHPAEGFEIGRERTPDAYAACLVDVFREVRRVLRDDGVLWLNLGDTYRAKELVGVPWHVALAACVAQQPCEAAFRFARSSFSAAESVAYAQASRRGLPGPTPALTPGMERPMTKAGANVAPHTRGVEPTPFATTAIASETRHRCPHCERLLPAEAFGKSRKAKNGLQCWCKSCKAKRAKATYTPRLTPNRNADLPGERWVPLAGYEGIYEVSDLGRVRALAKRVPIQYGAWRDVPATILKTRKPDGWYPAVSLWRDGVCQRSLVHRLVAITFHGDPPFPEAQVRHLDGSRDNNRADNLAWGTGKDNAADRDAHGRQPKGTRSPVAHLDGRKLAEVRAALASGLDQSKTARLLGVTRAVVHNVARGKTYREEPR